MAYIDRDKLIENKFNNDISYNSFVNLVKRQPTADVVERKRGKWIRRSDIPNAYTCSNCYQVIYAMNRKYLAEYHAFCGKCGLDMRGETDDAT